MDWALRIEGLVKRYGNVEAVRGIDLRVGAGEIFGLLGRNGAGKTTTMECVLGLRQPDGGSIFFGELDALKNRRQSKQFIGAQLQGTALQDRITAREALRLFAGFYQRSLPVEELIQRFELGEKADAAFESLSGGQKQRLGLALAFVNDPKIVLLDEPTAGLDPQSRRQLHGMIKQMRAGGRTVVLSTHYIEEAEQLCDRVAMIDHGTIVASGKPAEFGGSGKSLEDVFIEKTGGGSGEES